MMDDKRKAHMIELLGGDLVATRTVNTLWQRHGIATPSDLLRIPEADLAAMRGIGTLAALRIGQLRGSLRPGGRKAVHMTSDVLNEIYELLVQKVRDRELVSCAFHGQFAGDPPEMQATRKDGFGNRYTLVLTPSEIDHNGAQP